MTIKWGLIIISRLLGLVVLIEFRSLINCLTKETTDDTVLRNYLHSNNSLVSIIDERDRIVYEKRLANDLAVIRRVLLGYRDQLAGVVVESTYNWYWLVDGLSESGFDVRLANTVARKQYNGLKYTDDNENKKETDPFYPFLNSVSRLRSGSRLACCGRSPLDSQDFPARLR